MTDIYLLEPPMKWTAFILMSCLALGLVARADDKKPETKDSVSTMELRANEAFNRGQYSLAKELFNKVAERVKEDKKRYEAIQEQIRVCDKNIKDLAGTAPAPAAADQVNAGQVETAAEKRKKHV